jgi:hypothetical protein
MAQQLIRKDGFHGLVIPVQIKRIPADRHTEAVAVEHGPDASEHTETAFIIIPQIIVYPMPALSQAGDLELGQSFIFAQQGDPVELNFDPCAER